MANTSAGTYDQQSYQVQFIERAEEGLLKNGEEGLGEERRVAAEFSPVFQGRIQWLK